MSIWHCKRTSNTNSEVETFAKPKEYSLKLNYLSIQPVSGYTSIMQFGERVGKMWLGTASYHAFCGIFTEGDKLYIDGAKPNVILEMANGYGYSANASIKSVQIFNRSIRIEIEKLI